MGERDTRKPSRIRPAGLAWAGLNQSKREAEVEAEVETEAEDKTEAMVEGMTEAKGHEMRTGPGEGGGKKGVLDRNSSDDGRVLVARHWSPLAVAGTRGACDVPKTAIRVRWLWRVPRPERLFLGPSRRP